MIENTQFIKNYKKVERRFEMSDVHLIEAVEGKAYFSEPIKLDSGILRRIYQILLAIGVRVISDIRKFRTKRTRVSVVHQKFWQLNEHSCGF